MYLATKPAKRATVSAMRRLRVDHLRARRWRQAIGGDGRPTRHQARADPRPSADAKPPRQRRCRETRTHIVRARGRAAIRPHPLELPQPANRVPHYNPGPAFCPGWPNGLTGNIAASPATLSGLRRREPCIYGQPYRSTHIEGADEDDH